MKIHHISSSEQEYNEIEDKLFEAEAMLTIHDGYQSNAITFVVILFEPMPHLTSMGIRGT